MASGYSQPPRDTQRVPRSCVQCSRRKIKCSKRIPCEACTRRGDSLVCSREVVRVNGQVTIALDPLPDTGSTVSDLVTENLSLRARIEQLEVLLARDKEDGFSPNSTSSADNAPASPQPPEDIVTTFEGLHLSSPVKTGLENLYVDSSVSGQHILSLLPIRQSSCKIVRFSLETLGWVHCALNGSRFMAEHDSFWNALESNDMNALQNHSWMAIYFSVLAVGAYFLDEKIAEEIHYIHEGFSGEQAPATNSVANGLVDISHSWYEAAFRELNRSQFFSKPQLSTVQALAILMILHRNFGESHREYFLLGLAINIARALGMDHLGQEGSNIQGMSTRPEWNNRSEREVGRRLWWTLVICDWMTVFSRPSSITPESFSSILSISHDNSSQDIILGSETRSTGGPSQSPSPLEYHIVVSKIAYVIHTYIRHTTTTPISVFKALQELNRISQNLPLHLRTSDDVVFMRQYEDVSWIKTQRIQLANLLEVCRVDLCFSCLPRLLETGEDEFNLQTSGLQAAMKLASMQGQNSSKIVKRFWGTTASSIAAGVYLILDLICFKGSKSDGEITRQQHTINSCIRFLQEIATPNVAGASILQRLLHLHSVGFVGEVMDKKKLLEIMKFAAIPIVKSSVAENDMTFQNDEAADIQTALQQPHRSKTQGQIFECPTNGLELEFGLADVSNTFDTGFAMDLDYMSFDDLRNLTNFDFSGPDLNHLGASGRRQL